MIDQNQFLYFNLFVAIVLILFFYFGRRSKNQNIKTNLKVLSSGKKKITSNKLNSKFDNKNINNKNNNNSDLAFSSKKVTPETLINKEEENSIQMKSLNVIFMYNGHSWDAYEVLGVKPGASILEIKRKFEEAISKVDPKSQEFYKMALSSILEVIKKENS